MGFRYRPNPAIEDPMQAEAELLMQEEQAAMMPNTPRDPVAEIKKKKLMEEFLRKGGGPGYGIGSPIPQSQNPFAERVPDEKEQAMTAAALRHAQAPSVAEVQSFRQYPDDFTPSQKEWDNDNPMAPTIDRAGKELQVDRPSDLPGAPDNPKPPAPEDLNSKPGNSALREALMQSINGDQNPKAPPMYSPEYVDALKNNSGTNRNLGLMALLAKSSNQMGAIGGKVADSSGVEDFSNMAVAQNNAGMGQINALESQRMKQSSTADKTKLILELLKLDQGAESNNTRNRLLEDSLASRNQTSQAMTEIARGNLDVRRNPPAPVLNPLQEEKIKADIKLTEANAKKANAPGAGKLVTSAAATLDSYRKTLERTNAEYDQILKSNPSYKQGNAGDAAAGALGSFGNVFKSKVGQQLAQAQIEWYRTKLRKESGATIGEKEAYDEAATYFPRYGDSPETIAAKKKSRQAVIEDWKQSYEAQTGAPAQSSLPAATTAPGTGAPPPAGKVRIFDPQSGGNLLIDQADLEEALKEPGVRVVK